MFDPFQTEFDLIDMMFHKMTDSQWNVYLDFYDDLAEIMNYHNLEVDEIFEHRSFLKQIHEKRLQENKSSILLNMI